MERTMESRSDDVLAQVLGGTLQTATLRLVLGLGALAAVIALVSWIA